jgi:hypothetical protein
MCHQIGKQAWRQTKWQSKAVSVVLFTLAADRHIDRQDQSVKAMGSRSP